MISSNSVSHLARSLQQRTAHFRTTPIFCTYFDWVDLSLPTGWSLPNSFPRVSFQNPLRYPFRSVVVGGSVPTDDWVTRMLPDAKVNAARAGLATPTSSTIQNAFPPATTYTCKLLRKNNLIVESKSPFVLFECSSDNWCGAPAIHVNRKKQPVQLDCGAYVALFMFVGQITGANKLLGMIEGEVPVPKVAARPPTSCTPTNLRSTKTIRKKIKRKRKLGGPTANPKKQRT
eukprot:TRINITY_DN575_c0_g1_i1.p2 TRINITY_DN575_c0_g1~~TRINITY_DN575_c0_g1_i1.p2  ORF type:complete len:231 (+),score=14.99 TRINITY_DN575_c0_g1_i1:260-952(+)